MPEIFRITNRHYQVILKQGLDNLPQEVGGFLGGDDGMIKAILPLYNAHLYNKTDTFSFTPDDVLRAHDFFNKHSVTYYGLYHTHPKGIAYPSKADIDTGHQYHFIMSFKHIEKPDFRAYRVESGQPIEIPLRIIEDKGFSTKVDGSNKKISSKDFPSTIGSTPEEESEKLNEMINNIRADQQNKYPTMPPRDTDKSDFSTLA
ncbi:MAG: hypothetical protein CL521_02675 [Actinobacteria bacterium]|nr:hypothetical protein [Actinomycetota bacterium]